MADNKWVTEIVDAALPLFESGNPSEGCEQIVQGLRDRQAENDIEWRNMRGPRGQARRELKAAGYGQHSKAVEFSEAERALMSRADDPDKSERTHAAKPVTPQPIAPQPTELTMTQLIELLELSPSEQADINAALSASGKSLAELCKRGLLAQCRTVASQAETQAKRADEFEGMTADQLRGSDKRGAAYALAERAIDAILTYNDYEAPSNAERWYLTQGLVAKLSGIHQATAKKAIEARHVAIADHNAKWGLRPVDNRKQDGSGGYIDIQDAIELK